MSQRRTTFQMMGERGGGQYGNIDTTYTKIFVGGLAWETQRETMRHYFAQFGEIHEAVVITDKNTGRSKGYGFVTFRDPEAAIRACENPNPTIDGRRANCNLASLGAQKPQNPPIPQHGVGRFRLASGLTTPPAAYQGSSSTPYFHLSNSQYTFPYSPYGYRYSGYPQDSIYPVNYYNVYGGGQQFQPYYAPGSTGPPGIYQNYIPYYPLAQNSQSHGLGVQYPHQMLQMPYLPQQQSSMGLLSVPSSNSVAVSTTSSTGVSVTAPSTVAGGTSQPTGTVSDNNSST